ncbi:MAG TPA: zinc ribbon domain-containing protein [Candidatus Mediterraneibacter intestinipullorum]|nr:zinc ribbon domain-containing protein [Candidatus Mediterraneibacter intestinipullorum]
MRDFFEDLGKRIGETAETVTSKAGDAIEIQRIKGQIRGLARGNAADLIELGRTIYDRYKAGEEVEESARALCDAVRDREASIEDYEKKIAKLRGTSACSGCGRMVSKNMSYCPYCGEKVPVYEAEAEEVQAGEASGDDCGENENVKEKVADAVDDMAEKAEEAAKKAGSMARKAAEKTGDALDKAADKAEEMAHKAAGKAEEMAQKAADKVSEAADKAFEKIKQKQEQRQEQK